MHPMATKSTISLAASVVLSLLMFSCRERQKVSADNSGGSDDEGTTTPVNISGTYLACNMAADSPYAVSSQNAYVGCSVKDSATNKPVSSLSGFSQQVHWGVQSDLSSQISFLQFNKTSSANPYHAIFRFIGVSAANTATLANIAATRIKFQATTASKVSADISSEDLVISSPLADLDGFAASTPSTAGLVTGYLNVYIGDGYQIGTVPATGLTAVKLPTINTYKPLDGCYVACYSHLKEGSSYPVSDGIYVMGQVRVRGEYLNQMKCEPADDKGQDISQVDSIKQLCSDTFSTCPAGACWGGGDTYPFLYSSQDAATD